VAATVIQMSSRESNPSPRHDEALDTIIGAAIWGCGALISATTFYLIGHWVAVLARHFHHS
jgi:hypothetical protein